MLIYKYSEKTKEFITSKEARQDPKNSDNHLIPAHSTVVAPPTVKENEVATFNEVTGVWSIESDHRGSVYYEKANGNSIQIIDIGDISDTLTESVPGEFDEWDESLGWVQNKTSSREAKMNVCNSEAGVRIDSILPDWMNRRHIEQKDLVARGKRPSTKLPEDQFEIKQEQCDEVRDASDTINDWIEDHSDPASITNEMISTHSAWPNI